MSAAGDTDINIVINVTTDSLKEANKLAKELATTLKELSGTNVGSDIISKSSISQTKELATGVTELQNKLNAVGPVSDKAYQALVALDSATIKNKIDFTATGASFTNLVKTLNMSNERFEELWGTMKQLPNSSMDDYAKGLKDVFTNTNPAISKHGEDLVGLSQLLFKATGNYNDFVNAVGKVGGKLLSDQDLAQRFGKQISEDEYSFNMDSAIVNMRQTAVKGIIETDRQATREMEKMRTNMERETDKFTSLEAKTRTKILSGFEADRKAESKSYRLPYTDSLNEETQKLEDFARIKERLTEQGKLNTIAENMNFNTGGMGEFSSALQRITMEENRVTTTTQLMTNAFMLTPQELQELSSATGISAESLKKFSEEERKAALQSQMMKTYMQSTRASIGPLGTAFREIGMQVYWAALGMLFYTITLAGLANYQYTVKNNTLALAKSYYNLEKLQRSLNDAIKEYGITSQEARDASASLAIAQQDMKMQQLQLGTSLKQQIITGFQGQLTLIPLVINSIYAMIQAQASLNGITSAGTTKKVFDATVTRGQTFANQNLSVAQTQTGVTYSFTTGLTSDGIPVKTADMMATHGQTRANIGLIGTLRQLITLRNLAIPAIGAFLAIGATLAMDAYATSEADKQVKALEADARVLADSFNQATVAGTGYSNEMNGNGTVSKDSKAARLEVKQLNDELLNLQDNANLNVTSNAKLQEEVIAKVSTNNGVNLTINIYDPIVKDEANEDRIVEKIYNSFTKEMRGAGVQL